MTLTYLPFGLVEDDIAQALAPYGKVHEVKFGVRDWLQIHGLPPLQGF